VSVAIDLSADVAVVTGAARGNGRAIALGLARAGAKVVCADVLADGAAETAGLIRATGGHARAVACDVGDRAACAALAADVAAEEGACSVLVNNAGIAPKSTLDGDTFEADWDDVVRVNATAIALLTRAFLPQLRATRGRVVNVGSIVSFRAAPRNLAYSASKGAVLQLTLGMAQELAADGIRVNGIAPGVIATPMTAATRADPEKIAKFLVHTPMGRVGEPDELVGPVLFLASELSSYVTGVMLPVDGGYLAV
jgi:NAD(P)-dependent dehydrogenase (short-subunit alcohol dehydrogenase family)